jgi:hypothetical protein
MERSMEIALKTKIKLPFDPVIILIGTYMKEYRTSG